jgi:hypothetical protein
MFARMLIIVLIVTLALPVASLTGPGETYQTPWSDSAEAAKGKHHKKAHKKAKTRTVRQPVTQTFTSSLPLTIVDNDKASPYPATIAVSGMPNGVITDVNLLFNDLTHTTPRDIDLLLSASNGRRALVMSDVGNVGQGQEDAVVDLDLILDDEAGTPLPVSEQLSSGTFQPTNHLAAGDTKADAFTAPAPAPDGSVALSTFDGADPNGTWQVWMMDDVGGDKGTIASWALQITAEVDVQVQERVKAKKKGKRRR